MSRIKLLPETLASQVAAGEVVERPASVVKELVENSIDAGARAIEVGIQRGGMSRIRVVDDGYGMDRDDALLSLERHATSKIASAADLAAINTLGFRGEALPSIASVSRFRLTTREHGAVAGTEILVNGGRIETVRDGGEAPGTQIEVRSLFYNVPARRKFLRSETTETRNIEHQFFLQALAHPAIGFSLVREDKIALQLPITTSLRDRIRDIYGAELLGDLLEISARDRGGVQVRGWIGRAGVSRQTRSQQFVFVNGRAIESGMLSTALREGYHTALMRGQFPVTFLFVELDPREVDVNVHPTKREVRFADQDMIHQSVRQVIRGALRVRSEELGMPIPGDSRGEWPRPGSTAAGEPPHDSMRPAEQQTMAHDTGRDDRPTAMAAGEPTQTYLIGPGCEVIPMGQIGRTFLVAQVGSELHVIDQHTAHERVLYERLWRAWQARGVQSQPLLIPEPVDLPPHGATILEEHLADLATLGLELESFGANSFVIRAVPALLGQFDYSTLVQDLVEDLAQWNAASSLETRVRPVLASLACHGAVRAGRALDPSESKRLIEDWVEEGLPMTCPHGRRVALRLPAEELARIFGRA